jgi:hypothetical protein
MRNVKRLIGNAAVHVCAVLDAIPAYEQGVWYRHGDWGCRLRISRLWAAWGD